MRATFFITYVMVDGWTGVAGEILRLRALIIFHLKNFFLVKTEKDREEAMDPGSICFDWCEPRIQLYFLLGLVYAVVTPLLLPFILVFFGLAYVVYRHQVRTTAATCENFIVLSFKWLWWTTKLACFVWLFRPFFPGLLEINFITDRHKQFPLMISVAMLLCMC